VTPGFDISQPFADFNVGCELYGFQFVPVSRLRFGHGNNPLGGTRHGFFIASKNVRMRQRALVNLGLLENRCDGLVL